jgi:transcriptional regulator with XRE-family HTH domain
VRTLCLRWRVPRSLHSEDYRKLTAILLNARKRADLTQQQVADRLGRPQSFIAKVEGGERRIDLVELVALSRAIGADPRTLLDSLLGVMSGAKKSKR